MSPGASRSGVRTQHWWWCGRVRGPQLLWGMGMSLERGVQVLEGSGCWSVLLAQLLGEAFSLLEDPASHGPGHLPLMVIPVPRAAMSLCPSHAVHVPVVCFVHSDILWVVVTWILMEISYMDAAKGRGLMLTSFWSNPWRGSLGACHNHLSHLLELGW